jgi:hypothetical protein
VKMHRWRNPDGQEWACVAYDHGPFCRRCQPVTETLYGLLENVRLGRMEIVGANPDGEFKFRLTAEGEARAEDLIHNDPEMADLWARLETKEQQL